MHFASENAFPCSRLYSHHICLFSKLSHLKQIKHFKNANSLFGLFSFHNVFKVRVGRESNAILGRDFDGFLRLRVASRVRLGENRLKDTKARNSNLFVTCDVLQ